MAGTVTESDIKFMTYNDSRPELTHVNYNEEQIMHESGYGSVWIITHTFFHSFRYKWLRSLDNREGSRDMVVEVSTTSGTVSRSGNEWSVGVDIGASYNGMEVKTSMGYKTFNEKETTNLTEVKRTVSVAPGHIQHFYQKVYTFRRRAHIAYDAWADLWRVCKRPDYETAFLEGTIEIEVEDFLTKRTLLAGSTTTNVEPYRGDERLAWWKLRGRKWENTWHEASNVALRLGWSPIITGIPTSTILSLMSKPSYHSRSGIPAGEEVSKEEVDKEEETLVFKPLDSSPPPGVTLPEPDDTEHPGETITKEQLEEIEAARAKAGAEGKLETDSITK